MEFRILGKDDLAIWKEFRLESLKNSPENFGSSYEEEINQPDSFFLDFLIKDSKIFAGFIDNILVACAGFHSLKEIKTKHRGYIWGVYTKEAYRGKNIGSTLIKYIIKHESKAISQFHLACVTSNLRAIELYKKLGFIIYGTEHKALKVGNNYFGIHLMILYLV